jgi:hypothetical protein
VQRDDGGSKRGERGATRRQCERREERHARGRISRGGGGRGQGQAVGGRESEKESEEASSTPLPTPPLSPKEKEKERKGREGFGKRNNKGSTSA